MWPEEVITLYASYHKSLPSKTRSRSSAPPTSVSSPQPSPHTDIVRGLIL